MSARKTVEIRPGVRLVLKDEAPQDSAEVLRNLVARKLAQTQPQSEVSMAKKPVTRERFSQDDKIAILNAYEAADAKGEELGKLTTKYGRSITASHISAFKKSVASKGGAVGAPDQQELLSVPTHAPVAPVAPVARVRAQAAPVSTPRVSERIRIGLELAVSELGGSISWH